MQNPPPIQQLQQQQQPRYKHWQPPWIRAIKTQHSHLPTFGDLFINYPRQFLENFGPVKDAISIINLNQDMIYKLRRKFHGNKKIPISTLPFPPLSEISNAVSVEDVVVDILEAVLRTVRVEGATTHGMTMRQVLDRAGIPKCHQSFVEKFLSLPDLSYSSFLVLMSVYFDLWPLSKAHQYQTVSKI